VRALVVAVALLCAAAPARAYRPFVSTDADVAAYHTLEIEMGIFGVERIDGVNSYISPQTVLNFGFLPRYELVAETDAQARGSSHEQLVDDSVSVKHVWREGELQDQPGPSFASETSILAPSTNRSQPRFGFEHAFMLSHRIMGFTLHWNAGAGLSQDDTLPFVSWGLIVEHPLIPGLRAVGELNGFDEWAALPDHSGLVGLIWDTPVKDLALDVGYRRGITAGAETWGVTTGFSLGLAMGGTR
jgi:hypothetical protein